METATRLLNESRAKLAELDQYVLECESYVRRMLELTISRKPARESEERVARGAFLALVELEEVRDRWRPLAPRLSSSQKRPRACSAVSSRTPEPRAVYVASLARSITSAGITARSSGSRPRYHAAHISASSSGDSGSCRVRCVI